MLTNIDLTVQNNEQYQLLDSGSGRKLELISTHIVDRPTPAPLWSKRFTKRWNDADSFCVRKKDGGGFWQHKREPPQDHLFEWGMLKFKLSFTQFGHCGIFFEQIAIWELIKKELQKLGPNPKALNLFGYTGAASVIMASLGAEVTHVDSASKINKWGEENQKLNQANLKGKIHWKTDDVLSFLRREEKSGQKYDFILMDPPSWGSGVKKEQKWIYEKNIKELFELVHSVSNDEHTFLVTTHTPGVQKYSLANLFIETDYRYEITCGDIGVAHQNDPRILPAGIYCLGQRK